jgi:hypothetical protein
VGVDLNPLAVAISEAKIQRVELHDVLYRLSELAASFDGIQPLDEVPDALKVIYHPRTLTQLCYLRGALTNGSTEDSFIRGVLLGIMHGKVRKDGSSSYLSIDMPNTFSMSPQYVREFVRRNGLRQQPFDVFSKLAERCNWLLRDGPIATGSGSAVIVHGDGTNLSEAVRLAGSKDIGAIVTSPPYLGVLRYGAFNWIRLWFLGYDDPTAIDKVLDGTDSLDRYLSFVLSFFQAAGEILPVGGVMALVVGDVKENGQHLKLASRMWEEMMGLAPFELVFLGADAFDETSKTTRIWGEAKKGRATPLDRILVLRRMRGVKLRAKTRRKTKRSPAFRRSPSSGRRRPR